MEFSAAADELYAAPPEEFVATRTRLAALLSGDDAKRLKSLRRPTVSAWAVNLLVRDGALEPLLELGERLRAAWSHADRIASLERERAESVGRLVRRARSLAEEHDRPLSESVIHEIEDTLQATVADADSAQAVGEGRLSRPLSHAGFGAMPLPTAARPPKAAEPAKPPERDGEAERKRAAEAEQALSDRTDELDAASRELAEADEELTLLRSQLADLEKQRAELLRRKQRAGRECEKAARVAERARRRLSKTNP